MDAGKRTSLLYWIFTLLVLVPSAGSGIPELFGKGPEMTVQSMLLLGYPLYLMKILGFSKILGALAILTGRFPTMKEWAYAGFSIDFLGATASHLLAGDYAHAPFPFVFFLLLMVSYHFSKRRDQRQGS
jgi:hypothetical protein